MSMFRGPHSGRSKGGYGVVEKVPLNGLFSDGIWQCNCDPRQPAIHLQTQNGGENHGKWFYTCRKPQHRKCKFFLWEDQAKFREAAVNNFQPYLTSEPLTPVKPFAGGFPTPQTSVERNGFRRYNPETLTPFTPPKSSNPTQSFTPSTHPSTSSKSAVRGSAEDEVFSWPSSDEDELLKAASQVSDQPISTPDTPQKTPKTHPSSTPGKRTHNEMTTPPVPSPSSQPHLPNNDPFTNEPSPSTTPRPNLFTYPTLPPSSSPSSTPTPRRPSLFQDIPGHDSDLASQILRVLTTHQIALPAQAKDSIRAIANQHALYTHGVEKGRDVSRTLIRKKSETITELQAAVAALRADRETHRILFRQLRKGLDGVGIEAEAEEE